MALQGPFPYLAGPKESDGCGLTVPKPQSHHIPSEYPWPTASSQGTLLGSQALGLYCPPTQPDLTAQSVPSVSPYILSPCLPWLPCHHPAPHSWKAHFSSFYMSKFCPSFRTSPPRAGMYRVWGHFRSHPGLPPTKDRSPSKPDPLAAHQVHLLPLNTAHPAGALPLVPDHTLSRIGLQLSSGVRFLTL